MDLSTPPDLAQIDTALINNGLESRVDPDLSQQAAAKMSKLHHAASNSGHAYNSSESRVPVGGQIFPNEVLSFISSFADNATLARLAQVSKALAFIAEEVLYSHLVLREGASLHSIPHLQVRGRGNRPRADSDLLVRSFAPSRFSPTLQNDYLFFFLSHNAVNVRRFTRSLEIFSSPSQEVNNSGILQPFKDTPLPLFKAIYVLSLGENFWTCHELIAPEFVELKLLPFAIRPGSIAGNSFYTFLSRWYQSSDNTQTCYLASKVSVRCVVVSGVGLMLPGTSRDLPPLDKARYPSLERLQVRLEPGVKTRAFEASADSCFREFRGRSSESDWTQEKEDDWRRLLRWEET